MHSTPRSRQTIQGQDRRYAGLSMARYELARIRPYKRNLQETIFAVHVLGPLGERWIEDPKAARIYFDVSGVGDGDADPGHREAVDRMTQLLLEEGWEPFGKDDSWFPYTFRREVRDDPAGDLSGS